MDFFSSMTWICIIGLAYHYVGYPLIVYVMSRLIPHVNHREPIQPRVSLIVSAYNEEAVISQKIDNTMALDYPRDLLEIIVVTDGSSDATAEIVAGYQNQGVILLHKPERGGKSAAINRAADKATGEILIFSDANAFYRNNVLRKLLRNFSDQSFGCVSGKKTILPTAATVTESENKYWKYESFIKTSESRLGTTTAVVGEMIAFRRKVFSPIPSGIINDDASHEYLRLFLPVLMFGALMGSIGYVILAQEPGLLTWVLFCQAFFYTLAMIGWLGERYQQRWKIPALAYYVVRASLTPMEGFWGFIRRTQTALWEKVDRGNPA